MVAAAILAGGAARRMGGQQKALLPFAGGSILARQLAVLGPLCDEVVVITNDPVPFAPFAVAVAADLHPGAGPLAGLEAAFAATRAEVVLLVAGDMPLLVPSLLRRVADLPPGHDAVVPRVDGRAEPLHAAYHRRLAPLVSRRLEAGERAMHAFLACLRVHWLDEAALRAIDPDLRSLANANTPAELAALAALP